MKKQLLHIIVWKEEKIFVAKFLELELASQGKNENEAVKNLKEAFDLYLEDEGLKHLSFPSIDKVNTKTFSIN
ncbi:MAG: type II toxin-antitoxin system HicB family antitoxin [Candidatus Levybacteria bacterium]|nr:type II toxin-antitoxin system HicB family antitoxin [Candidatus Levybacteria bacterium]